MYTRYFWQGNHHTYGHIRCVCTVLANPNHTLYQRLSQVLAPTRLAAAIHVRSGILQLCMCTSQHLGALLQYSVSCSNHKAPSQECHTHLSPSMLLKSFTMAMPRPAMEYNTVRMQTSRVRVPNRDCVHAAACKFIQMYEIFFGARRKQEYTQL